MTSSNEPSAKASATGPAAQTADWRFLLSHPAHWVALGLGSGLMRPGPGTWGTALGWLLFALAFPAGTRDWSTVGLALAVALLLGTWAAQRATLLLGEADPSVVVVDESGHTGYVTLKVQFKKKKKKETISTIDWRLLARAG